MIGIIVFIFVLMVAIGWEKGNQANATYHHKLGSMQRNAYTYKDGNDDRLLSTGEKVTVVGNKIYNKQGLVADIDEMNRLEQIRRLEEMCKGKYNFRPAVLPPSMYKYETWGRGDDFRQVLTDDKGLMFVFARVAPPLKPNEVGCLHSEWYKPKQRWCYRRKYITGKHQLIPMFTFGDLSETMEEFDHDINFEMSCMRLDAKRFLTKAD